LPNGLTSQQLREFARRGVEERLRELREERRQIEAMLRTGSDRTGTHGATEAASPKRRRKPMSAAQRKAVGERMRKYWAARRKAEGQK